MAAFVDSYVHATKSGNNNTSGRPYPELVVYQNLFDHFMSNELWEKLTYKDIGIECLQDLALEFLQSLLMLYKHASEKDYEILVVTPPGFMYWPVQIQTMVVLVQKALLNLGLRYSITAPNVPLDEDFRPPHWQWPAALAWLSKTIQSFPGFEGYDITLDDATMWDWSVHMHDIVREASIYNFPYTDLEKILCTYRVNGMDKSTVNGISQRRAYHQVEAIDDRNYRHREYPSGFHHQSYPTAALGQGIPEQNIPVGIMSIIEQCNYCLEDLPAHSTREEAVFELAKPLNSWSQMSFETLEKLGPAWQLSKINQAYQVSESALRQFKESLMGLSPVDILALYYAFGPEAFNR